MKVALFTETYLPYINGVVTHVKILKEGLEALGHEVLIVTADASTKKHYIKDGILHCPAAKIKKYYNYSISQPISMGRLSQIRRFSPDVIHIHNEFGIGLSGVLAAKRLNIPSVYTLHTIYEDYVHYIAPAPLFGVTRRVMRRYTHYFSNRVTVITGPSLKCEEFLRASGVKKPIYIIPNAVELDSFSPERVSAEDIRAVRERYGIARDAFTACFVGRLGKEKSVDVLLSFWAQQFSPQDKFALLIVGNGPERPALEQMAKELGIGDMVHFTGPVPHEEIPPCYAACNAYLTASLSEAYSISMLEGMASGLPVLQRLDPSNQDQIQEGVNGYLYTDAPQMARRMRELADLAPEEQSALKRSVIRTVQDHNATKIAEHMLGIYEKAIAQKASQKKTIFLKVSRP
jgi:1,2-diacylglycerol 3-alpha-glucosyltransferase